MFITASQLGFFVTELCLNQNIRAAVQAACLEHPDVATRALAFVGVAPTDSFWRPARDAILSTLKEACLGALGSCQCLEHLCELKLDVLE